MPLDTRGDPVLDAIEGGELGAEATIRALKAKLRAMQASRITRALQPQCPLRHNTTSRNNEQSETQSRRVTQQRAATVETDTLTSGADYRTKCE